MSEPRKWLVVIVALAAVGIVGWFWDPFELKTPPAPPRSPIEGHITMISGDYDGTNLIRFRADDGNVYAVHLDPKEDYGPLDTFQEVDRTIVIEWKMSGDRALATDIAPVPIP